jgi:hypothetical protein
VKIVGPHVAALSKEVADRKDEPHNSRFQHDFSVMRIAVLDEIESQQRS